MVVAVQGSSRGGGMGQVVVVVVQGRSKGEGCVGPEGVLAGVLPVLRTVAGMCPAAATLFR